MSDELPERSSELFELATKVAVLADQLEVELGDRHDHLVDRLRVAMMDLSAVGAILALRAMGDDED